MRGRPADTARVVRRRPTLHDVTELPIAALRELADAGEVEGQTELGERYEHGRGLDDME